MGLSFRCYDFWDHSSGQALLMIGGWYPSTQASSRYPSSLTNFPDKLDRWRQIRHRRGRLGTRLGGWYSRQSLSNACPPKRSQNSLHQNRPVARIKWLRGLSEWPTLTPPPPASVPRLKHTCQLLLWMAPNHFHFRVVLWFGLFLRLHQALCH